MPSGESRGKSYAREKYAIFFTDLLLTFVFLAAYQIFLSPVICAGIASPAGKIPFYLSLSIYLTIFCILYYIAFFPLHLYSSFLIDHKYSLSNQAVDNWVKDEIKRSALSFIIFLGAVNIFYFLIRTTADLWWVCACVVWLAFTVLFAKITPNLIIPLFYKYSPIKNKELKNKICDLAKASGIRIIDVLQLNLSSKTKKANAAVIGLGGSRRVVLGDTLLSNFTPEEIEAVIAHEFAHHKEWHMQKMILFSCALTGVGFFILSITMQYLRTLLKAEAIYDIKLFPAFALVMFVFGLAIMPAEKAFSRMLERDADKFSLRLTNNRSAFITLMSKLAELNLSDANPPKAIKYLLYDHPPISERINMAESYTTDDSQR